jgi:hypothetical protein
MTSIRKTTKHWRNKSKKITEDQRFPMLINWQNQHSKNDDTTKSNLHVQCNSYQSPNDICHRNWKINPKVHLLIQNIEQNEQSWRLNNTQLQTIIQCHINKNSIVLVEKQIWRLEEQNRGSRYESMQLN